MITSHHAVCKFLAFAKIGKYFYGVLKFETFSKKQLMENEKKKLIFFLIV